MDSLNINSGEVKLAINGNEDNLLIFNPEDILFAEKFYELAKDFAQREDDFNRRLVLAQKNTAKDEHGLPKSTPEVFELVKEICNYIWERLDIVFGEGTSAKCFGGVYSISALNQFMTGIEPYIAEAREGKVAKYMGQPEKTNVLK